MRILGIDPGSVATGYGVVERRGTRVEHVAHGTLRPPRGATLPERLAFLHRAVTRLLAEHRPERIGVERVFAGRGARSALILGQARGAVLAALAAAGVTIHELAPQHVKLAVTGTGGADKQQVQAMVKRLLALAELPQRDAADALAAALCCAHRVDLDRIGLRAAKTSLGPCWRAPVPPGRAGSTRRSRVVVRRIT